ncbi:Spo0B domain-containing protein [Caldalkalibacillus salinus]|uniref:Spo0B domain-containing protein n=1 Tax=Caldalkalibacillus salinus TaxID=2803787 RepID=UPI001921707A|nr:Spo0B domain-containing protein [Caldalkalibacillus salinus]
MIVKLAKSVGERTVSNKEEQLLNLLKHYRHDWLNDIQIVKGYLTLGKIEDAQRHMDRIIFNAQDESRISQIGDAELAYELMTYNWVQKKVKLHYELDLEEEQDLRTVTVKYPTLKEWVQGILKLSQDVCIEEADNNLYLSFDVKSDVLELSLELDGQSNHREARKALQSLENDIGHKDQRMHCEKLESQEWMVTIVLPVDDVRV